MNACLRTVAAKLIVPTLTAAIIAPVYLDLSYTIHSGAEVRQQRYKNIFSENL